MVRSGAWSLAVAVVVIGLVSPDPASAQIDMNGRWQLVTTYDPGPPSRKPEPTTSTSCRSAPR